MLLFIIRRVLQSVVVLWVMSMIAFAAMYVVGSPTDLLVDPLANVEERERAIQALGLDRPVWQQYLSFVQGAIQLDFGRSFISSAPVGEVLMRRLPATIELTVAAFFISILIGLPLGILAGLFPKSIMAKSIMTGSVVGFSLPNFWVGLMLIMVFAVTLGWLPATGRGPTISILGTQWAIFTWDGWRHLILPATTLALINTAMLIRLTRAGLREVMLMDYIKFARAKGLSERRVVWVHAMRNILIPIVTVQGIDIAMLLTGSIVTETVFAYPGIGRMAIEAINFLDRPVVVTYILFVVAVFIFINLCVDIVYAFIDPRVRHR